MLTMEKRANNSTQYRRNGNKKAEFNKNITCSEVQMVLYCKSILDLKYSLKIHLYRTVLRTHKAEKDYIKGYLSLILSGL